MIREGPPYWYAGADRSKLVGLVVLVAALVIAIVAGGSPTSSELATRTDGAASAALTPGSAEGTAPAPAAGEQPAAEAATATLTAAAEGVTQAAGETPAAEGTAQGAETAAAAETPAEVAATPAAEAGATGEAGAGGAQANAGNQVSPPVVAGLTPGAPLLPEALKEVTGAAPAGARVMLFDGAKQIGEATADENGHWTLAVPALKPGTHGLRVQVVGPDGKTLGASGFTVVTIAEGAGVTPVAGAAADVTPSAGEAITATAEVSGTVTAPAEVAASATITATAQVTPTTATEGAAAAGTPTVAAGSAITATEALTPTVAAGGATPAVGSTAEVTATTGVTSTAGAGATPVVGTTPVVGATRVVGATPVVGATRVMGATPVAGETPVAGATAAITATTGVTSTTPVTSTAGATPGASATSGTAVTTTVEMTPTTAATSGGSPRVSEPVIPNLTPGVPLAPDALGSATGLVQPGDRVLLYDGAKQIGEAQAGADGKWSLELPALTSGRHALWTQVVRPDGSVAAASRITLLNVAEGAEAPKPTPTPTPIPRVSAPVVPDLVPGKPLAPDATQAITGTAQPGDKILLYDGAMRIGEAQVDADGNWSIDLAGLPLGTHGLWAQVVGPDGKIVAASPLTVVTIAAPEAEATATPTESTTALATPRRQVDAPVVAAQVRGLALAPDAPGEITGKAEAGEQVVVFDGGLKLGEATADADGNWRFALPAMAPGPHGIWTQVHNADGKVVAASPVTVIRVAKPDAAGDAKTAQGATTGGGTTEVGVPPSSVETPGGAAASSSSSSATSSSTSGSAPVHTGPPDPGYEVMYTVQAGDTLANIAWAYRTTATHLARINNISNPDLIITGSTLRISRAQPHASQGFLYTVVPRDTLGDLGWKYGWTALYLARVNGIRNPDLIFPGQVLFIPASS
jgi:large repetitive protein